MYYRTFDIVYSEIIKLKNLQHQYKVRDLAAVEKVKQQLLEILSLEEVVELVYKKCPSYGERIAFINLFRNADDLTAIKLAEKRSKIFSNVNDCNSVDGMTIPDRVINTMQIFKELYALATHPNSQDGEALSYEEHEVLYETIRAAGFLIADATSMLDNKVKKNKQYKRIN